MKLDTVSSIRVIRRVGETGCIAWKPADDAFAAECLLHPGEPGPLLIWADWRSEQGDGKMEHALRWMAFRRRWPHHREHYAKTEYRAVRPVPRKYSWGWYSGKHAPHFSKFYPERACLPQLVFSAVVDSVFKDHIFVASFPAAVLVLADGLERLREALAVMDGST